MEEENKVCNVNGYLTFQKDLLNFSLSQNFHDDLACIFVILCLMVRLGANKLKPSKLSVWLWAHPVLGSCLWARAPVLAIEIEQLRSISSLAALFLLQLLRAGGILCHQSLEHSKCSINVLGMKEHSGQWEHHHLIYRVSLCIQLWKDMPSLRRVDEDGHFDSLHSHSNSVHSGPRTRWWL